MSHKHPPKGWLRWIHPETYNFHPSTPGLKALKTVVVTLVGFSVVAVGILMIVTPGPAILVIPAGLAILALEFAWARRWLRKIKAYTRALALRARRGRKPKETSSPRNSRP